MAGTDSGLGPGGSPGWWRWDVALSFAAAQRAYVEQVARALQARGVRCFYDADEEIDLWGKYLAEELPTIYGEQAAAVVVFISAEYAARDWTRLERRAALDRAVRERREYVLPARFDDTPLPGLISGMVTINLRARTPEQCAETIAAKLAALGVTAAGPAGSPASGAGVAGPPGAIRVAEADLRRLGVHAAISVPGVPDEVPPEYVPRDVDAAEHGVRARVAAAAERGGFVLLVGGSSVGKTRCAAEAARALLPDWWLVHPDGPAEVAALTVTPSPRMVVWLDELQRYLDGEHGLTGGAVRALLGAPGPVVIIGTLWPDRYAAYTALPGPGEADPHAREREVLDLAAVIRISEEFSAAEQDRARALAARDPRVREALAADGYGMTQTLAAAPQLVARWEDARGMAPYAWAVLTAALDAARLGARAPLSAEFLRAAAPGYCTPRQQAEAPPDWLGQALAYATAKLHGAAAALAPAGAAMGQTDGYTVADYLLQYASRERRAARVPASTWDALLGHVRDPADTARLAGSAQGRLLYGYAIPLYRHAADAGDEYATWELARLLAGRGDLDEAAQIMRVRVDAGDWGAAARRAEVLADVGDLDGLRALADADDFAAAFRLADRLAGRGDLDEAAQILRRRADDGDDVAALRLAELLAGRGDLDGAANVLEALADAGDWDALFRAADLLADTGNLNGLRALADDGYIPAAFRLADRLTGRGDLDEAAQVLQALADAGDLELRARADAGDEFAALRLAELLAECGDLDGAAQILRRQADDGDDAAAFRLAELLAGRGDLDGAARILRARADTGESEYAASRLADLQVDLLAERGDLDGLRAQANAGGWRAALRLAELLAGRGDLDGLRAQADAGNEAAASRLADLQAELLAERGDLDGLRAQADAGNEAAALRLAELLAGRGDLDGLRALADAGNEAAARRLADVLIKQGQGEEAERLRRFGLNPDGSIAHA